MEDLNSNIGKKEDYEIIMDHVIQAEKNELGGAQNRHTSNNKYLVSTIPKMSVNIEKLRKNTKTKQATSLIGKIFRNSLLH